MDRIGLGAAIRTARSNKSYTQEQLAEIAEITPSHEKHIESGHRLPSVEVLFRLAQTLNMSLDNIVFPEAENGRLKEIHILLRQCGEVELAVLLDVAGSLLRNRGSVK